MKIYPKIMLTIIIALLSLGLLNSKLMGQAPSAAIWFYQTDAKFDANTGIYTIVLRWGNGKVDEQHPIATHYKVYRSMIGHNVPIEEYDLIGTTEATTDDEGFIYYNDEINFYAGFFYYLVAVSNGVDGEKSNITQGFPGSYCVNMDAEIVDFVTYPRTLAYPNENYTYNAFAKHRSPRVQGWVRYSIIEAPEGATIDSKNGTLKWQVPSNNYSEYSFKIKATSEEDARAEAIQEWIVRTPTNDELISDVEDSNISTEVYPNPASNYIRISSETIKEIETIKIINIYGEIIDEFNFGNTNEIIYSTNKLSNGVYTVVFIGKKSNTIKNIVITK